MNLGGFGGVLRALEREQRQGERAEWARQGRLRLAHDQKSMARGEEGGRGGSGSGRGGFGRLLSREAVGDVGDEADA